MIEETGKKNNTSQYDVIIIGGGASGLMAAIQAAGHHAKVLILEHQSRAGVKILSTGNGRCNLTNSDMSPEHFCCADPSFPIPALNAFSMTDTISFFRDELHIICREKDGYWYPRSNQAATVRDAFISCCERYDVSIRVNTYVKSIQKEGDGFLILTDHGSYRSVSCILCCGGKAFPKSGSDGSGYRFAKEFGHSIVKPLPALSALYADKKGLSALAGVRAQAAVSVYADQTLLASDQGEVQFTDYGISGIPVFQVSRHAAIALHQKKDVTAVIDFLPEFSEEEWDNYLTQKLSDAEVHHRIPIFELLCGVMQKKVAAYLLEEAGGKNSISEIVRLSKHFEIPIVKTASFAQAQTTTGGVRITEIDPDTMSSRLEQGLYFAGEMLDVDGICGGYNLQWAWSSGSVAGISAVEYVQRRRMR